METNKDATRLLDEIEKDDAIDNLVKRYIFAMYDLVKLSISRDEDRQSIRNICFNLYESMIDEYRESKDVHVFNKIWEEFAVILTGIVFPALKSPNYLQEKILGLCEDRTRKFKEKLSKIVEG